LKRALNLPALDDYLSLGATQPPATIIQGVHQLPPGHYLVWERGQVRTTRYWDVPVASPRPWGEGEALEALDAALTDAVRVRLMSDVPLGAFLSGGVDSSAVVEAMARTTGGRVVTVAVGFEEARFSELPHARAVSQALGADHHEMVLRPSGADILPQLVWHLD